MGRTVRKKRHARMRELERLAASAIVFRQPLRADSDAELAHAPDPGYGAPAASKHVRAEDAEPAAVTQAPPDVPRRKRLKRRPDGLVSEPTGPQQSKLSAEPLHSAEALIAVPEAHRSGRKRKNKFKDGHAASAHATDGMPQVRPAEVENESIALMR